MFVCVCVLTSLRTAQYDQIMRWWGFSLGNLSLQSYTLSLIVIYFYPASTATLVPTLDPILVHFPTRSSPVSIPESPPTAQGQPTARASPVSVP